MAVIWNTSCKKYILWARDIKRMLYQISGHVIFLVSCLILMGYIYFETILNDFVSK